MRSPPSRPPLQRPRRTYCGFDSPLNCVVIATLNFGTLAIELDLHPHEVYCSEPRAELNPPHVALFCKKLFCLQGLVLYLTFSVIKGAVFQVVRCECTMAPVCLLQPAP